jgi:hypothetical protein
VLLGVERVRMKVEVEEVLEEEEEEEEEENFKNTKEGEGEVCGGGEEVDERKMWKREE